MENAISLNMVYKNLVCSPIKKRYEIVVSSTENNMAT